MYRIKTQNLELILTVVAVKNLLFHEETLPDRARRLLFEFKNWSNLQDPIIVEKNLIVLDGNHRASVFKRLNITYIPVCIIDYFHEGAELRYWFRVIGKVAGLERIRQAAEDMGGRLHPVPGRHGLTEVLREDPLACGIQHRDLCASITFPKDRVKDAVDAYAILERLQNSLLDEGMELSFLPCRSAEDDTFCDSLGADEVVLWTPHITKDMVVEAAKNGRIFAPKSTRHCIPARPLKVNVPTTWFKEKVSLEKIDRRFTEFLEEKGMRHFGPGQVIDGRYYEEEVFVFYDKA